MKKLLLLAAAIVALNVQATKLYVNPSHPSANDTNWGDTPGTPWKTLNTSNWKENDSIMVSNSVYTLSEKGFVNKSVTVIGESKNGVIFQGEDDMSFNFNMTTVRFFSIGTGVEATFNNVTIKNLLYDWHNGEPDATSTYGGAFELTPSSTLNLKNVDVKNIKIYGNGGNAWGAAIMNRGIVNADNCSFENCYATQGGVMFTTSGSTANFTNCKFIGNGNPEVSDYDTYRFGGAICMVGSAILNVDKCNFEKNFTEKNGMGGVFMIRYEADKKTIINILNSTFSNNKSSNSSSILYCGANTAATPSTELLISIKNSNFYKNIGNISTLQYNNTMSLPTKANYKGVGRFVFVNNSLFGNFNPERPNTRSISIGDVNMDYYIINNLMNDNETDAGTAQAGTYGFVLEGSYDAAPLNIKTMIVRGNVFNATGGAFSSINFPDLSSVDHPEMKNFTGQKLIRTQQQTKLKSSEIARVPYLDFTTASDSVSVVLNNGINEYLANEVNIIPQTDILGNPISGEFRDTGAWEMQVNTAVRQIIANTQFAYPNPFNDVLSIKGRPELVEIYSMDGQCVVQYTKPENNINVSSLQAGLYLIKLTENGISQIQKSIKK